MARLERKRKRSDDPAGAAPTTVERHESTLESNEEERQAADLDILLNQMKHPQQADGFDSQVKVGEIYSGIEIEDDSYISEWHRFNNSSSQMVRGAPNIGRRFIFEYRNAQKFVLTSFTMRKITARTVDFMQKE